MLKSRSGLVILLSAVYALAAMACSKTQGDVEAETAAGQQTRRMSASSAPKAPDFQLRDVAGKVHRLSHYDGKIIILDFWDTWCPPCKAEIPDFVDLQKKYESKGIQIIGVAFGRQGLDAVKSFMKKYKINYPILLANQKIIQDYGGIQGIPTTFVIDQEGNIYRKYVGYRSRQVFEQDISSLLALK